MSDIPLRKLKRNRGDYTPLDDSESRIALHSPDMTRTGTIISSTSRNRNYGRSRLQERYIDDPEEAAGLLAGSEDGDEESDDQRRTRQRPPPSPVSRHSGS